MNETQTDDLISPKSNANVLVSALLKLGLLVCCFLFILAAFVPLDSFSQLCISIGIIAIVYAASSESLQHHKLRYFFRIFALILGSILSVRYLVWRGFHTLETTEIISLVCMWILFIAEIYAGIIHLLGCFINVFPLNRPELLLKDYSAHKIPTVDVMVPTYNEPEDLLEITLRAALLLEYPQEKLHIHLLDDGGTDQKINQKDKKAASQALERRHSLQSLCKKLGVQYHTREKKLHAKAGNINSALGHTDSELIVILDADHVPTTDFLERTVPWMIVDEKVFLVQSPHFMANPDPVERNYFSAFTRMPSENDMFYGVIQKGLDFWSSSFFCGSAAVLKRECLELVGGIAGDSITEDAETALELHSLGYKSVYVDKPMISGLAPETFASFIQQRIRWAQGMAQILILKKPFLNKGLSWYQKCGYMSSILFWLFPFARLTFLLSPLGYLVFGLELIQASILDVFAYTIPHVLVTFRQTNMLFGKNRWPLVSELYEILQCTFIFRALITVVRNPTQPSFVVTPKGENLNEDYVSSLSNIFYWLLILLGIGSVAGVYEFFASPLTRELTAIVFTWNSFNFILCLGLLEVLIEKKQLRKHSRLPAYDKVKVSHSNGAVYTGHLVDMSVEGARLDMDCTETFPDTVIMSLYTNALNEEIQLTCSVRYQNADSGDVRVAFDVANDDEKSKVVALTLCDSSRWESFQKRRTRQISYFYGLRHVLSVSITPIFKHIYMKFKQRYQ